MRERLLLKLSRGEVSSVLEIMNFLLMSQLL